MVRSAATDPQEEQMPLRHSNRFATARLAASFALLALAAAACTTLSGAEPTATARPAVQLKAGIMPYISYAPFFIADKEGYFTDQGLAVELVRFSSGAEMIPSLNQGQIDVAGTGPSIALFNAVGHDGTIQIVADKGYLAPDGCTYMAVLAPTDWAAQYPEPTREALSGRILSIGTTNFEAFMFETLIGQTGLTLENFEVDDISPPALIDAVQNNAVDLISQGDPWVTRLLDTGKLAVWRAYEDVVPNMQVGIVAYGPNLLEDDSDAGLRFMTAYLQAVRQYNQGKTDRNLEILAEYTNLTTELLQRACWPPIADDAHVNLDTILDYQTWGIGKGLVTTPAEASALYDPRFIEDAGSTSVDPSE
jgi:NitT/TauT family transport system substrate-binding protein